MKKRLLIIVVSVILFSSCSPTLKVKELNVKTGKLPTETVINQDEILVEKSINLKEYSKFLF